MGLLDDARSWAWEMRRAGNEAAARALGPHGRRAAAPVMGLLDMFSPGADMRDMTQSSQAASQNLQAGNIPQGLLDLTYAAVAPAGVLLPGSISGYRKGAEAIADHTLGLLDEVDPSMPSRLVNPEMRTDEASRMARAREMFPSEGFHGTDADIAEFSGPTWITDDPAVGSHYARRARAKAALDEQSDEFGEYVDIDEMNPEWVEGADDPTGMNVMPLRYDAGKQLDMTELGDAPSPEELIDFLADRGVVERPDDIDDWLNELTVDPRDRPTLWKMIEDWNLDRDIQRAGYDSLKIDDVVAAKRGTVGHDSVLIFDPKNIRSKFAKFDPAKKDSADILAGAGGGLLGAEAYRELQENEKDRR